VIHLSEACPVVRLELRHVELALGGIVAAFNRRPFGGGDSTSFIRSLTFPISRRFQRSAASGG
jgi:hypothetical protein